MWHFVVKINSLKVVRPSRIIFVKHNCSYDYHSLIFSSEDILKQLFAAFERIRCLNRNKTGHKEKCLHFYSNILYKSLNQLRKSLPVQVVVTSAHTHTHTHTHTQSRYLFPSTSVSDWALLCSKTAPKWSDVAVVVQLSSPFPHWSPNNKKVIFTVMKITNWK